MPQVNATQDQTELSIVRDVLHQIAHYDDSATNLQYVLETICEFLGASAGAVFLFNEPQLFVSHHLELDVSDEKYEALMAFGGQIDSDELVSGLNVPQDVLSLTGHILGFRVVVHEEVIALMLLSLHEPFDRTAVNHIVVESLLNGLLTVIKQLRLIARHEKLSRNQSEFLRIVSHDLRSPLTSMKGFASMLEAIIVEDAQKLHFVEKILSGIGQMTSQIDNFQDAGRYDPETGFYEMERHLVDVADLVNRIVDNQLIPAEKLELSVTTNSADNVPIINADINMLERAVINLVDNAIKYTPNGGNVEVGVFLHANNDDTDKLIISVKDTGYGISVEDQKMLFERHVRIHRKEHKRVKGSGLGLFIVRSVAQRHGGDAWVESEIGNGSTFKIGIPLIGDNLII